MATIHTPQQALAAYLWRVGKCHQGRELRFHAAIRRAAEGDLEALGEAEEVYQEAELQAGLALWMARESLPEKNEKPQRLSWGERIRGAWRVLRG